MSKDRTWTNRSTCGWVCRWFVPVVIGFRPSQLVQDVVHPKNVSANNGWTLQNETEAIVTAPDQFLILIWHLEESAPKKGRVVRRPLASLEQCHPQCFHFHCVPTKTHRCFNLAKVPKSCLLAQKHWNLGAIDLGPQPHGIQPCKQLWGFIKFLARQASSHLTKAGTE